MPGSLSTPRRNAFLESRGLRYLLYALGEVLLIFIGITLAVAFDNAAQERERAELTAGLLTGVLQDLEANRSELNANIEFDQGIVSTVDRVLHHIDSSEQWTDSMSVELEQSLHWSSPFLSSTGYEGLKQAGLYRVDDPQLRAAMVQLYEGTYGFLVGDHDRSMWEFWSSYARTLTLTTLRRVDGESEDMNGGFAPVDYEETRARGELRTMFLEQRTFLRNGLEYRMDALAGTEALMASIEAYLEERT